MRRRRRSPARPSRDNQVLWLTVCLMVAVAVLAVATASVVRSEIRREAYAGSARTAELLMRSILYGDVPRIDALGPDTILRLDRGVDALRETQPVFSAIIVNREGRILYAHDHALIGRHLSLSPGWRAALEGRTMTVLEKGRTDVADLSGQQRLTTTLAIPSETGGLAPAAFEASVPYGPVAADISRRVTRLLMIIGAAALLLYAALLPRAIRATRVMRGRRDPERQRLLADLERALRDPDQIRLVYQPIASVRDRSTSAMEALVRWQHPVRGLVAPDQFIPLVDGHPLEWPLAMRIFEIAIAQAAAWERQGLRLSVAVNVSTEVLRDPRLPGALSRALASAGLDPELLELELTESATMQDPLGTAAVLERLGEIGVSEVALDDFGTGYSSLARLNVLPLSILKIDRSFMSTLHDTSDGAMVEGIISMAHSLGLKVVAEGVEHEQTWSALTRMRCDLFQGYWLSRPMAAADATSWLLEHRGGGGHEQSGRGPEQSGRGPGVSDRRRELRERYYEAAFEEALDAVVILDDRRQYLDCNPAACRLFEMTREELLTTRIDDHLAPEGRAAQERGWEEFMTTGFQRGLATLTLGSGRRVTIEYHRKASFLPGRHLSILRPLEVSEPEDRASGDPGDPGDPGDREEASHVCLPGRPRRAREGAR